MSRYFISLYFLILCLPTVAQTDSLEVQPKDSIVVTPKDSIDYRQPYGIRFGVDLSRPLISFLEDNYTGLEFVGDYRLTQKLYVAGEFGNEKKTIEEDLYDFTASGSYIKLGVDYNTYANWYGEYNAIFVGGRYAFSSFSQTVNNYQIYDTNRYWSPSDFATGTSAPKEYGGLTASWIEAVVGVKAELFANIYLGASVRIGALITNRDPDGFRNLFIPGFNKVTDGSRFGVGYNYSLTYFLPLYKKANKSKKKEEAEVEVQQ